MIAGLALALEQHDPMAVSEMRRRRRAGDAGADDNQVGGLSQSSLVKPGAVAFLSHPLGILGLNLLPDLLGDDHTE